MKRILFVILCVALVLSCKKEIDTTNAIIELNAESCLHDGVLLDEEYQVLHLANGQTMYMDRDSTFFLGDIIFSKEQVEKMNTPQPRAVVLEPYINYWPNKKIYYIINPDFTSLDRVRINSALSTLENTFCMDFAPSTSMSSLYCITFAKHPTINSSPIGMNSSKRNTINLVSGGFDVATVMHEVMHSLGFFHEQSRNDRDNYVIIYPENIKDNKFHNFEKVVDMGYQAMNLSPFDFDSIMIYESNSFAKADTLSTMTKLDGTLIPYNTTLSDYDIAALNFIYGPKPVLTTTEIMNDCSSDNNSIDYYIKYSNIVTFQNMSGQPVALTHPRLLVIDYYKRTKVGENNDNDVEFFNIIYQTIPAGATHYELPNTEYIRQEDLGINRYYQDEHYSIRVY